tara:strand:- start:1072 stop:1560 length:489 start_codon:yes stop_codon:yes gene_type:complete
MGSSPSKVEVLKCPNGFDKQKFKKICTLFDKLDKDSNLGVSSDEIEYIAVHHVDNCILRMEGQLKAKGKAFQVTKTQITLDENNAIVKVKHEFETRRQQEALMYNAAVQSLENRKTAYQGLDKDGKANTFIKAVSGPGDMITFWSFFEYMKTRTGDIENIKE